MQGGFVKVAVRTPEVRVADVDFNTKAILEDVLRAHEDDDAKVVVLPELCGTAYTGEDPFWQEALPDGPKMGSAAVSPRGDLVHAQRRRRVALVP